MLIFNNHINKVIQSLSFRLRSQLLHLNTRLPKPCQVIVALAFIHWSYHGTKRNLASWCLVLSPPALQWGAADAEIKVPSGENTEHKHSPFTAWSRSLYSLTCYAFCQGFFPCLFLPFWSIHLHFFPKHLISSVLAVANTWFLCRPAE